MKGKDGVVGYFTHLAKNDQKTFVMLLRAVLPLQIEQEKITNRWHYEDGPVQYPTVAEIQQKMRQAGMPVLLHRLEPVVTLMREGKSASEAMRAVGLNARLEQTTGRNDGFEDDYGTIHDGDHDEQSDKST